MAKVVIAAKNPYYSMDTLVVNFVECSYDKSPMFHDKGLSVDIPVIISNYDNKDIITLLDLFDALSELEAAITKEMHVKCILIPSSILEHFSTVEIRNFFNQSSLKMVYVIVKSSVD